MELELLHHYAEGNWKNILEMLTGKYNTKFYNQLYLWIQPTEEDIQFIGQQVHKQGALVLASVGCGTGLLEWLIQCITGLCVIGIEHDRKWWESRYAPPKFLPLMYANEISDGTFPSYSAIMFCYFNNKTAFREYMKLFKGNCLIIIGPEEGSGRHTDPLPFDPEVQTLGWKLVSSREIQNSKDHIVVYERC
ncbi:hypothetical protein R5R35_001384 [Gryllus longicercus]|uniref:Uncharacterized protein n=1 Tax=Gryllus longicercus TaxID=2509291 RepID=A0AAN9VNW7_9ORTH